jgi:molecular chaperone DnaK
MVVEVARSIATPFKDRDMASGRNPIAIGIDLGTTFSVICALDEQGRPRTLANAEGEPTTPSAVFFEGSHVVVGKEALKALATDGDQVALCAKRDLGQRFYHRPLGGRYYPPEALQAFILNKLRVDAQRQVGPFRHAVVTVPAYFDEVRRKATMDAAYLAGLELLDILNEPTAAAVAFGYQEGFLGLDGNEGRGRTRNVLVYDLGGGTFDVTVMAIGGRQFTALATDGDVRLGGHDWDERLVALAAEAFFEKYGVDPREDATAHGRLWRECEDAKRTLSARQKTTIAFDYRGQGLRLEVTRQQLEELTADLLERTLFTTQRTLEAAGLTWDQIDRVLLVGGSTRMPAVARKLKELSGKEPDQSVSPDEAVAQGAALHAGLLWERHHGRPPRFRIRNVNSHSLGVVAADPVTKQWRSAVLIPRNTPLPVTARRVFRTHKAAQQSILVQIVEGESPVPEDCASVGRCVVRKLPPDLPAQTPIEVRFHYEENGRLTVQVKVQGTDRTLQHELVRDHALTQEQLDRWREFISGLPPEPRRDDELSPAQAPSSKAPAATSAAGGPLPQAGAEPRAAVSRPAGSKARPAPQPPSTSASSAAAPSRPPASSPSPAKSPAKPAGKPPGPAATPSPAAGKKAAPPAPPPASSQDDADLASLAAEALELDEEP